MGPPESNRLTHHSWELSSDPENFREPVKSIERPSGLHSGWRASANSGTSCRAEPPAAGITYIRPEGMELSNSPVQKAIVFPSGANFGFLPYGTSSRS